MTSIEISPASARELTDRIKVGVDAIWELIKQAYTSRAWSVLGYSSWDDYCTREFGTSRIRLPREERQEVVASMREIGMSTRAIASATGVSKNTITADSQREVSQIGTPAPAPVTGMDGKTYSPRPRFDPELDARTHAVEDAAEELSTVDFDTDPDEYQHKFGNLVDAEAKRREIAPGITADELNALNVEPTPEPSAPRRRPITEAFDSATYELKRAVERVARLAEDDRLAKNKDQIAGANLSDLIRVRDSINGVINTLEG